MSIAVYPAYKSYKPSGVEWVSEIPAHWNIKPFFAVSRVVSEVNKPDLELLSVYLGKGVIRFSDVEEKRTNATSTDLSKYQVVRPGNLVLNNQQAWRGSVGVSAYSGLVSPAYIVLELGDNFDSRFADYYFQTSTTVSHFLVSSKGVGTIQRNLYWPALRRCPITIPPLSEQRAIAAFLSEKCAKIDEAVRIKGEQIKLLRERRQVLIQHAVTRGLNPGTPMKASCIDWIGQIPAHWEAIPIKYLLQERNERTKTGEEILFSLRMIEGLVPHDDVSDRAISDAELIDYKKVYSGQIVMNRMRASIGLFGIVDQPGLVSPDYAIFDIREDLFGPFYLSLFKTELMGSRFRLSSRGLGTGSSGFMRLYTDDFGSISVPVPTYREQQEIVEHIDGVTWKINGAISLKQSQIDRLKEYKTTLINAAVTGKIKVN